MSKNIQATKRYVWLHGVSDRGLTAVVLTIVMLMPVVVASFFLPLWAVLTVLFGPGILVFLFGGLFVPKDEFEGLSTNQRLAIERYRSADAATKKFFPVDWEETVRNARASKGGTKSDQYKLAVAADKIVEAARKRNESLNIGDDDVVVALQVIEENVRLLETEAVQNNEILAVPVRIQDRPTIKRMVGRKVVEVPNPLYNKE